MNEMVRCVNPAHKEKHHRPGSVQARECGRAAIRSVSAPAATAISPVQDPLAVVAPVPAFVPLAALVESERTRPTRSGVSFDDGVFSCDGGALFAHAQATRLGLDSRLCVGLYRHTDVEIRAEILGEVSPDARTLALIEADAMDEHHHWVEMVDPASGRWWLYDPNGSVRGEPHWQELNPVGGDGAHERYEEFGVEDDDRYLAYDPDADPGALLDEMYPPL